LQVVPTVHATRAQHEVAQSPAVSTVSPEGTQLTQVLCVVSQKLPVAQSALTAQVVLHAVVLAQAKLPAHAAAVPAVQVPEPLQLPGVSVEPVQDAQLMAEVGYWHAPAPEQVVAPHVPPVVHAAVQQSVRQASLAHSAFDPQAWPAESRQAVPAALQVLFVAHPVLVPAVQVVPQLVPEQARLFAQAAVVPAVHVPVPLQVLAVVLDDPVQEAARQTVAAG